MPANGMCMKIGLLGLVMAGSGSTLSAQTRQAWGVQASAVTPGGITGWELQLRRSFGRASLGFGSMYFADDGETEFMPFVEPRLVLGAAKYAALYAALRAGVDVASWGEKVAVAGGGVGLLLRLSDRVGLDLGIHDYVAFFEGDASSVVMDRIGLSFGLK